MADSNGSTNGKARSQDKVRVALIGVGNCANSFLQGLHFIEQQFLAALEEHGVSRLTPEPGQPLDPRVHQALHEEDAPGVAPGAIVRVLLPGYRLHDRLLRPAQVVVARRPDADG